VVSVGDIGELSQLLLDPIAFSNSSMLRYFEVRQQGLRGGRGATAALLFQQLNDPPLSRKVELPSGDILLGLYQSLRQRGPVH
jgi:hypothetical protein